MDAKTNIKEAFQVVLDSAAGYFSFNEDIFLRAYDTMVTSMDPDNESNKLLLLQSIETCLGLSELGTMTEYLISALLYYPLITNSVTIEEIEDRFGVSIAKVSRMQLELAARHDYYLPWYRLASYFHPDQVKKHEKGIPSRAPKSDRTVFAKAFISITNDSYANITRIVDRLYLLKHSEVLLPQLNIRQRLAEDTLQTYAPAAEMLGAWYIKWQLEDAAFKIINPDSYLEIALALVEQREQREERIKKICIRITNQLLEMGVEAKVTGRPKHIYSTFQKMLKTGMNVNEINDILAVRIIVSNETDCLGVQGLLYTVWPPAIGVYENGRMFRDYITKPKPNGYQSLHTTVMFDNMLLEVQIRTDDMHRVAEYGTAAHWKYNLKHKLNI